jgi:hypothetical protein
MEHISALGHHLAKVFWVVPSGTVAAKRKEFQRLGKDWVPEIVDHIDHINL